MVEQAPSQEVVIADQDAEIRQALRLVCEEHLTNCLVYEVAAGDGLLDQMEVTHPNIVLLEWELPGMTPAVIMRRLKETYEQSHVIVLSNRPETRPEALNEGACGFVYKGDPPDELIALLHQLMKQE